MLGVGVLVNDGGTNLQAILNAEKNDVTRHAKIVYVFSNNAAVYTLQRAAATGIVNECISPADLPDREAFHRTLLEVVEREKLGLVVLVGYLVKVPDEMVCRYRSRILNTRPSLIPSLCDKGTYGSRMYERVLRRGVEVASATVHLVDEGLDKGPILLQETVEVKPDDTPETLQRRVMGEAEWILSPRAIEEMAREISERGDGA